MSDPRDGVMPNGDQGISGRAAAAPTPSGDRAGRLTCLFEGKEYSVGSVVEMPAPDGGKITKTCRISPNGAIGEWY